MLNSDEIKKLIEELQSPDPHTRRLAAHSLSVAKRPEAIPALESVLHDPDSWLRTYALIGILGTDPYSKVGVRAFKVILQNPDPTIRRYVISAASDFNPFPHELFTTILQALDDEHRDVRIQAAGGALGRLAEKGQLTLEERTTALTSILNLLEDLDEGVRTEAILAIGAIVPEGATAVPRLLDQYKKETDFEIKMAILLTFYKLGPGSATAVSLLGEELANENKDIRFKASVALAFVGEAAKQVIPQLIQALRDPHGGVRFSAMEALANCGPAALAAIPELEHIRDTEDGRRESAANFIKKIRGGV